MRHDLLSHGSSAPLGLLDLGLAVGKILGVDSLKSADKIQIHPIEIGSMRLFCKCATRNVYIVETKPLERSTYMAVGHWCWFCWIPWIIVNFRWLKHPDAWWKKKSPHAWHLQKFPYKVLLWNWLLRIGIPSSTAAAKGKGWHIWHWLNEKRKIHMVLSFQHPTEIWDMFTNLRSGMVGIRGSIVQLWC